MKTWIFTGPKMVDLSWVKKVSAGSEARHARVYDMISRFKLLAFMEEISIGLDDVITLIGDVLDEDGASFRRIEFFRIESVSRAEVVLRSA